jgi:hypothetical protein
MNDSMIPFLSIWVCGFIIARVLNILGGPFARTYWKNELTITLAQSLIITSILVFWLKDRLN